MIKETDRHAHDGQRITYGTVRGKNFRIEINELNLMWGTDSTLRIGEYNASTDDTTMVITSDIPDEYKLHVSDINKRYGTYFLVKSQLSKGWAK